MGSNQTGKDGTEVGKDTKVIKDPTQLLADARKAGKDAVDAVLDLILEVKHELPLVYPRIDVTSALTISPHYTEEALKNVHLGLDPDPRCRTRTGRGIFQHYPADHLLLPAPDG